MGTKIELAGIVKQIVKSDFYAIVDGRVIHIPGDHIRSLDLNTQVDAPPQIRVHWVHAPDEWFDLDELFDREVEAEYAIKQYPERSEP